MKLRTYDELIKRDTFLERYRYLRLGGKVGEETFGFERYLNQVFYRTDREWKEVRHDVIIRDLGCDLGISGRDISGSIYVHHMNPVAVRDIEEARDILLDPEYLICASFDTHSAIHYGSEALLSRDPIIRRPNDTCPWKKT